MAGLLNQEQQPQQGGMPQQAQPSQQSQGMDYDGMIVEMETRLSPEQKGAWDRILAAGMKFLFDDSTVQNVDQYLDGEGDMATKLGEGAAGLIAYLDKESKGSMPKELVIPAGIALMIYVVKYLNKSGREVSGEDFANGITVYLTKILGVNGVSEDQFTQTLEAASQG
jgi:hypothetical protein